MRKLAVIPIESIAESESKGLNDLARYFNPGLVFDEVLVLSPFEKREMLVGSLHIIPTRDVELPARLKAFGVDVVRAYGGGTAADMACYFRVSGAPVIVSIHDRRSSMLHPSVAHADVVFSVAPHVTDLILKHFHRPERVWLRPNGVDLKRMKPRQKEDCRREIGWSLDGKYILHVGRKSPEKNLRTLIKIIKGLSPEWRLVAIGPGNAAELRDQAAKEGVGERCSFVGAVANDSLSTFYGAADSFCLPSLDEAMSNVVLEAFACGVPSVLSGPAALGVNAVDGKDALVIQDPLDVGSFVAAVQKLASDRELAQSVVLSALAKAAQFEHLAMEKVEAGHYLRILEMRDAGEFRLGRAAMFSLFLENLGVRVKRRLQKVIVGVDGLHARGEDSPR